MVSAEKDYDESELWKTVPGDCNVKLSAFNADLQPLSSSVCSIDKHGINFSLSGKDDQKPFLLNVANSDGSVSKYGVSVGPPPPFCPSCPSRGIDVQCLLLARGEPSGKYAFSLGQTEEGQIAWVRSRQTKGREIDVICSQITDDQVEINLDKTSITEREVYLLPEVGSGIGDSDGTFEQGGVKYGSMGRRYATQ